MFSLEMMDVVSVLYFSVICQSLSHPVWLVIICSLEWVCVCGQPSTTTYFVITMVIPQCFICVWPPACCFPMALSETLSVIFWKLSAVPNSCQCVKLVNAAASICKLVTISPISLWPCKWSVLWLAQRKIGVCCTCTPYSRGHEPLNANKDLLVLMVLMELLHRGRESKQSKSYHTIPPGRTTLQQLSHSLYLHK